MAQFQFNEIINEVRVQSRKSSVVQHVWVPRGKISFNKIFIEAINILFGAQANPIKSFTDKISDEPNSLRNILYLIAAGQLDLAP